MSIDKKRLQDVLFGSLLGMVLGAVLMGNWMHQTIPWRKIAKEISQDTHGSVHPIFWVTRNDVPIAVLQTPKGREIAYVVRHHYLAIGPLMDLKTGKNVTPAWTPKVLAMIPPKSVTRIQKVTS